MKKFSLILPLSIIVITGSVFIYKFTFSPLSPTVLPAGNPSLVNPEEVSLRQAIKVAIIAKHNIPENSFVISINKI